MTSLEQNNMDLEIMLKKYYDSVHIYNNVTQFYNMSIRDIYI